MKKPRVSLSSLILGKSSIDILLNGIENNPSKSAYPKKDMAHYLCERILSEAEEQTKAIGRAYRDVLLFYPQERKYYHSVWHIMNMFENFSSRKSQFNLSIKDELALFFAILFHDVVYKVGSTENEDNSIEFAKEYFAINPIKGIDVDAVYNLIDVTKVSHKNFDNELEKIIHDLDWIGFINYDIMVHNEELIHNEATRDGITDDEFFEGQRKFYSYALSFDIYKTDAFKIYNAQAKENIRRRIAELEDMSKK